MQGMVKVRVRLEQQMIARVQMGGRFPQPRPVIYKQTKLRSFQM